ncbi:MAG: DUF3037 domain-containing protein [Deltaproteobacteria bacterium]|nr:DUF3037 domain-containing protein [Deltaproteobacteria bacterium]
MDLSNGYYCLIQYCPDLSRLEAANIGVLLFCPERRFIRAKTAQGNDRIRKFFGSEDNDWTQINAIKNSIEGRLEVAGQQFKTLEDLTSFIATRANEIQITPPRPMKVLEPEQDLQELFEELVGGRYRQPLKHVAPSVEKALSKVFKEKSVEEFIVKDVTVTVPAFRTSLIVPFGFQNGRFNLIEPVRFQQTTESRIIDVACRHAVEGRSLYDKPDKRLGELRLVVVGLFTDEAIEYRELVDSILTENRVTLHTLDDVQRLIEEIRSTARKPPSQLF